MSSSQKSFLGRGALGKLEEVLTETSAESVFLVKSPGAYEASGAHLLVDQALAKVRTRSFDGFTPNPKWPDILSALDLFRKEPCDLIVAIGGGSTIDIGKLVSFLALQPAAPEAYLKGEEEPSEPVIPLVAIPTTAGSGSETTCFAVAYYEGKKYSVAHEKVLPYCCLVDPALTDGLPPLWSACSGLDAFCQAVESMWAVLSTDESVAHAKKAILLALEHLEAVSHSPTRDARDGMSEAAHLAGKAINISRTTASHALSYTMTSNLGVPHGHAVSVTLGAVMAYNYGLAEEDCLDPRGPGHVRTRIEEILELLQAASIEEGRRVIDSIIESTGQPASLEDIGVRSSEDIQMVADGVNAERLGNNPRAFTPETLLGMLQELHARGAGRED